MKQHNDLRKNLLLLLFSAVTLSGFLLGCEKKLPSKPTETATAEEKPVKEPQKVEYYYSPAYVSLQGEPPFNTITFKDVGVGSLPADKRPAFFTQLAQQLSSDLEAKQEPLKIQTVSHGENPEYGDPSFHLACGAHHIYVDLWRNQERTGYSMWSGCGEDDNFAWVEYPNPTDNAIAVLAQRLTNTLENAIQSNCFQKHCLPKAN